MTKFLETPTIKHGKGANRQNDETRKNENMNGSCNLITRLLPLPQPEFKNPSQTHKWLVKTQIAFGRERAAPDASPRCTQNIATPRI